MDELTNKDTTKIKKDLADLTERVDDLETDKNQGKINIK